MPQLVPINLQKIEIHWSRDYETDPEKFYLTDKAERDWWVKNGLSIVEANNKLQYNIEQLSAWRKDQWYFLQVKAIVHVAGEASPESLHWQRTVQQIQTSTHRGVRSDATPRHLIEAAKVNYLELQVLLPYYNVNTRDLEAKFPPDAECLPSA